MEELCTEGDWGSLVDSSSVGGTLACDIMEESSSVGGDLARDMMHGCNSSVWGRNSVRSKSCWMEIPFFGGEGEKKKK